MKAIIPKRLAPIVFGFFLGGIMTFFVTGISTVIALGISDEKMFSSWMSSWGVGWSIAFPLVTFVAPALRKLVENITIKD